MIHKIIKISQFRRKSVLKLLSIIVPCYNSESYMETCLKSVLEGGDEVEILIIDDGSTKDNTAAAADRYEAEYPGIVRAIHQENGGHGAAIMRGLREATGLYFKVVDSDDKVDGKAYKRVLDTLRGFAVRNEKVDMLLTNYVYDKQGAWHKKVIKYSSALPEDEILTWDDVKHFMPGQYILMHSVIYRTETLRASGIDLPEHTFYVDNIFVYEPLPYVKTLYYLNVDFYKYYIGREDQSVQESVMIGRIDQQILITKLMLEYYDVYKLPNKKMRSYMISYLEIMMTICSILAIKSKDEVNLEKKKELWEYLKNLSPRLYRRIRYGMFGTAMNLPGKAGRQISIILYTITQKIFGFN